jgi:CDP-4-dehydro-6-deoxyglucose reductase
MSFSVLIKPSGHSFTVEQDESVLDAALRQGYTFPYGCRNGGCGACKGKLLAGEVAYGDKRPPALSEDDIAQGLALFCQARPTSDLTVEVKEVSGPDELEIKTLPAKVVTKEFLADDVVRLFLKTPESERLQFLAGQYIDILLKDGRHRSFSIANAPHDDALIELHIRHVDGGDFTGYVCDTLKEKDILRIEGPHGNFYLREGSKHPLIFLAGGTGFAPIKGIIEHALAEGLDQPMYLYWGVRDSKDLYLAELPHKWAKHLPNFHFIPVLSSPSGETDERKGNVHEAVIADFPDGFANYEVYASGPPAMVYAALDAFKAHGLPEQRYYSDAFEYQAPKKKDN